MGSDLSDPAGYKRHEICLGEECKLFYKSDWILRGLTKYTSHEVMQKDLEKVWE